MTDLAPLPPTMTGTELIMYVNGIIKRMNAAGAVDMPLIPLPSPWEDVRPAIDAIEDRLARWEALGPEMADVLYAYQDGQDATDLTVSALVNDPTNTRSAVAAVAASEVSTEGSETNTAVESVAATAAGPVATAAASAAVAPIAPSNGERAVGQGEIVINVTNSKYAGGAVGDGATTGARTSANRAAIQAAEDAAAAAPLGPGSRIVYFPAGTYYIDGPIVRSVGTRWLGDGQARSTVRTNTAGQAIMRFTGTIVTAGATEQMGFITGAAAGNVWELAAGTTVTRHRFVQCYAWQVNTAASIYFQDPTAGMYDCTFDTCHFLRRTVAGTPTQPGFKIISAGTYFNSNTFTNCRCEDTTLDGTTHFFHIESTGSQTYQGGNHFIDLNMTKIAPGWWRLINCRGNTFTNVVGYDNGFGGGSLTGHMWHLTGSAHTVFTNCDRRGGTPAGFFDIKLDANCMSTTVIGPGAGNTMSYDFGGSTTTVVGDLRVGTMTGTSQTTYVSGGQLRLGDTRLRGSASGLQQSQDGTTWTAV